MTRQISPREWEALSAYLDRELSPREQAKLESSLERFPELRSALEDLRRTRLILRSQPLLRAPRNFTLTPEMVGQKRPAPVSRAYPFFRFASAFAAILLVFVLIGDLFTGAPIYTIQPQDPQIIAMEAAPGAAPEVEEDARLFEAVPAAGEMEDSGGEVESFSLPVEKTPAEETLAALPAPETASGTSEPEFDTMEAPAEPPDSQLQQPAPNDRGFTDTVAAPDQVPSITPQTVRIIEIGLAIAALLAGAIALILRRTMS